MELQLAVTECLKDVNAEELSNCKESSGIWWYNLLFVKSWIPSKEGDAFILIYNHGIFSILRPWTSTMYNPNLGAAMERFFGSSKAWM